MGAFLSQIRNSAGNLLTASPAFRSALVDNVNSLVDNAPDLANRAVDAYRSRGEEESSETSFGSELAAQINERGPGAVEELLPAGTFRNRVSQIAAGSPEQRSAAFRRAVKEGLISGATGAAAMGLTRGSFRGAVEGLMFGIPGAYSGYTSGRNEQRENEINDYVNSYMNRGRTS